MIENKPEIFLLNSLNKTIDQNIDLSDQIKEITMLKNEIFSFFVAIKSKINWGISDIKITGIHKKNIKMFNVGYVNAKYIKVYSPDNREADNYFIHKNEGMFPDILFPYDSKKIHINENSTSIVLVQIKLTKQESVLSKNININVVSEWNDKIGSKGIKLNIIDKLLPDNKLLVTHWFHYDCLAETYSLKMFSKKFYKAFENYLLNYVEHGNTMLLVPLFTPCLDTQIGHERLTAQLVDVELVNGKYKFDFERLNFFLNFIKERGIKYFEFSHLFTQWGCKCCPKIIVKENGKLKKMFGWKVKSDSVEYYSFLSSFLPQLNNFLKQKGYKDISYFHISDEPNLDSIEIYQKHKNFMKQYLSDYKFLDALSDYTFKDHVDLPVVSDDHIQKFIDNKVPCMTYYCCVQAFDYVPNIFINMPSLRNRILGFMLYLNDTLGFLQWGFNFYHSALSRGIINPFICNDSMGSMNPGDAFLVYPDINYKPINSIRNVVFNEAIQDYLLCKLVEKSLGRKKTKEIIRNAGIKNFTTYSHKNTDLLKLRSELINNIK